MLRLVSLLAPVSVIGMAAMGSAAAAQPMRAPPGGCDAAALGSELARSATWYKMIEFKRRRGHLPPVGLRTRMTLAERAGIADLISGLAALNSRHPTYALVYGGEGRGPAGSPRCVWLVGPSGVLASAATGPLLGSTTQKVWAGLQVVARSAPQRSRRSADGRCKPDAEQDENPAGQTDDFLRHADAVLRDVSREMLPPAVEVALDRLEPARPRLLIATSGDLRKVPFAALRVGSAALIDRFVPVLVPSVEQIRAASGSVSTPLAAGSKSALVIGNPDLSGDLASCWTKLPKAEEEASNVAEAFGVRALIRSEATHGAVMASLQGGRDSLGLIYFATHGVTDPENPADGSFLALAGAHLRGAELRALRFASDPLVVMSACQTGLGKTFDDGVFGLAEAWYFTGARRVVMSLWDVDDAGTAELMTDFMRRLRSARTKGPEFALAEAMREKRRIERDPMIWAAFTYYGLPTL